MYGMGVKRVSEILKVNYDRAMQCQNSFYAAFPLIKAYEKSIIRDAQKNGFISTISSRRRYVPKINSKVGQEQKEAERQAFSTVVQGSAADIVKLGMLKLSCAITQTSTWKTGSPPRLLMQIHDEVLLECHVDDVFTLQHVVNDCFCLQCENDFCLEVPLLIDCCSGRSWGNGMQDIPPSQDFATDEEDEMAMG